jgi:hypothetical protein
MNSLGKSFALVLVALFLLSLVNLPSVVLADSELTSGTFALAPGCYIQFSIELQKNDRFEGNFTVSDLLSYKPVVTFPWVDNDIHTYSVDVTMIMSNPEFNKPYTPQKILDFNEVEGNSLYFFNWTAIRSAHYLVIFYCSEEYFPQDARIPQMTFNYNVREDNFLKVNVLSPLSQTYEESSIPLNFTVSRANNVVTYSLNRKDNVTLYGNTTLTGLSNGMHSVTVYTNDTFRYTDSQTVTFTIDKQEPFSTLTVVIGLVVVVVFVVAIASLIFYRRHRKPHP